MSGGLVAHRTECRMPGHRTCYTITHGGHVYLCHSYTEPVIDRIWFVIARDGEWRWGEAGNLAACKRPGPSA